MGLFEERNKTENDLTQVPVWFMRQAGRYHNHYQNIKKDSDFMTMCKDAKLATEITMGPIDEFKFDAAIMFSDLLFPLEQLNMGLSYITGPPTLERKLETLKDVEDLKVLSPARDFYHFQKDTCINLKERLPSTVSLLGFVGAPFTLYSYAVEGSHKGNLTDSKKGLYDGRFKAFMKILMPELLSNMAVQAEGGADAVCLFDTAAGELAFEDYKRFILPVIRQLTSDFKELFPKVKITYYSKFTHMHYLKEIQDKNIDTLGIDWRMDLKEVLQELGDDYYIQGNIDPSWLHLSWEDLKINLNIFWQHLQGENLPLNKWIMGLGHGVLPKTPQENVKKTVEYIHNNFLY
jgi:uroporphyrinogen decarboxylase